MYKRIIKRLVDILLSLALLFPILLLVLLCGLLIRLEDRGPVFYCAPRLGRGGRIFHMYKLRTMKVNAPDIRTADGSTWNSPEDPRVTCIGRLLRETSLDEIPQIFNVLKGEMSLIGPRPDPPDWLERYEEEQKIVLSVLPGITGYNQVYFRNSANGEQKIMNDVYYVTHISGLFDARILLKTIASVIRRGNIYTCQQAEKKPEQDRQDGDSIDPVVKQNEQENGKRNRE
jgi:lipopolysaccharide/colanic/teichoic acid biosynthesis glycosyltransferase